MKKTFYFAVLLFLVIGCKKPHIYDDPIPVHDLFTIESKHVEETRTIAVWTPSEYNSSSDSYPVLYMADGGIKEDFPHIANTLAKLIENSQIPPIILVGIENTERGRDLTGFSEVEEHEEYCPLTDGAKNFRNFITNELMSEINDKYRTNSEKGLIGESLSGLFVMETFFLEPEAFDFYIAIDPSFWWNNNYLVNNANEFLKDLPNKDIKLWFAGSNTTDISPYTNQLAEVLDKYAPGSLIWKYSYEPDEKHHTIFRATKEKSITWGLNR